MPPQPMPCPAATDVQVRAHSLAARATVPDAFDTRLFAQLVAAREVRGELHWLGLDDTRLRALYARRFPGEPPPSLTMPPRETGFTLGLHRHLIAHRNPALSADDADDLALIIAHACLRPDHLWKDLGLAGREDVTQALQRYFPGLPERNTTHMRWKKFLAYDLAAARGEAPAPAPGCPGCEAYRGCFPQGSDIRRWA